MEGEVLKMDRNEINAGMADEMARGAALPGGVADCRQARRHFSKIGLVYVFATILINGLQFAALFIAKMANPELLDDPNASLLLSMLPMYAIAVPIIALVIRVVPKKEIAKRDMTFGSWLLAFVMCYGLAIFSNLAGTILTQIIGALKHGTVSNVLLDTLDGTSPAVLLLVTAVCAPIAEEILFRKLLVDRLIRYGEGTAILVGGLMFGLFHGNLNQFLYAFVIGMFFCFIYAKTGNILYTITMHMTFNFLGSIASILVLNLNLDGLSAALEQGEFPPRLLQAALPRMMMLLFYAAAEFGVAITGIVLFFVLRKRFVLGAPDAAIPRGKWFSTVFVNIGMALYVIIWIVVIVRQLLA